MERQLYETFKSVQMYHWWYRGRRKIILTLIDLYSKQKNNKVLEIGCGVGSMLEELEKYGQVEGVEYDSESVKYCTDYLKKNVKQGMLPNGIPCNEKYDIIGCFDVLEHVDDDIESLKTIKNYLSNEESRAYITVPAFMFLWGENDELSMHKRRYTKKELCEKAESVGLKTVRCSYFNTFLFLPCLLVRKFKKIFGIKGADLEVNKKDGIINKILTNIFSFEALVLRNFNFPFGVSLMLVVGK